MARALEVNGKARQAEGEAKVVRGKVPPGHARKLRGIYFIDPEDTEFKETIKNARRKLETSVALAMPCKLRKIVGMVHPTKFRRNLRVFWKLMNPQEWVWETQYHQITKTILQEEVKNHYSTTTWFTSLFLCLKL